MWKVLKPKISFAFKFFLLRLSTTISGISMNPIEVLQQEIIPKSFHFHGLA